MSLPDPPMRLDLFSNPEFDRGASRITELAWIILQGLLFGSWIPGSGWRRVLLRLFGAKIGQGVVLKPGITVKFPWRLDVGDHVWIGEKAWIDNLAPVTIGSHSCVSQGAYLCTGSHNWNDLHFSLITRPIIIGRGCWVGAFARLAPGCEMENGAIITMNALGSGHIKAGEIRFADGATRQRSLTSTEPQ